MLGQRSAAVLVSRLVDARPTGVAGQLVGRGESLDLADLGGDRERQHPADPRGASKQRDVGVVCVAGAQTLLGDGDLALEVVDSSSGRRVAQPGLGDIEAGKQFSALGPERVGDRAGAAEADQGRVDAVLERRAVLDQVQAKAGELALLTDSRSSSQIAATRSRWLSVASTFESTLSVLQAIGAKPLTRSASAISTAQPPARACRGRSGRRSSTRSPRGRARRGPPRCGRRGSSATRGRARRRAGGGALPPRRAGRRPVSFRLRSNPACNM